MNEGVDMGIGGSGSVSPSSHSLASQPSGDNINGQAVPVPEDEPIAALKPKRKKRVNTTSVSILMVTFK